MGSDYNGERLSLVMECLRYALFPYRSLDKYVKSLLGEDGPGGGDPGWWIVWIESKDDAADPVQWGAFMDSAAPGMGCFEVWLDDEMGVSNPSYGYYSKAEVFSCVREKLRQMEFEWPERRDEARLLSSRFIYPQRSRGWETQGSE